jgi:hypothetical protein
MVHDAIACRPLPGAGRARPTKPGDTRFWCSCDPERQYPFYNSAALVEHVTEARAREAGHGGSALTAGDPQ